MDLVGLSLPDLILALGIGFWVIGSGVKSVMITVDIYRIKPRTGSNDGRLTALAEIVYVLSFFLMAAGAVASFL